MEKRYIERGTSKGRLKQETAFVCDEWKRVLAQGHRETERSHKDCCVRRPRVLEETGDALQELVRERRLGLVVDAFEELSTHHDFLHRPTDRRRIHSWDGTPHVRFDETQELIGTTAPLHSA